MGKIKACIFDLDGVIVDTAKYHYLAWRRLANCLGFDFSKEDNERLKGVSRMRSLDILLEIGDLQIDEEEKLKLAERKNEWYREYIMKMDSSEILLGAVDFIKELKDNNIKIALGSSSKNAKTILKQIDMIDYFEVIIDGTKVSNAKPHPEVFLKGANELNVASINCVVFEDAIAGIEAAKTAGMYAIGVGVKDILRNADKIIPGLYAISINEIINI
ncbi:MAG: beta-phosphoglucomutase [Firmicutes bacterium]|nr:beta-phosphoglucomutase [Bacillota bacterium]